MTAIRVPVTFKIKYNKDQYQYFTGAEQRTAILVARSVIERDPDAKLYREDETGIHPVSLSKLPEKSGSQKRKERKLLDRQVVSLDTPVLTKNENRRPRRKSVKKALVKA